MLVIYCCPCVQLNTSKANPSVYTIDMVFTHLEGTRYRPATLISNAELHLAYSSTINMLLAHSNTTNTLPLNIYPIVPVILPSVEVYRWNSDSEGRAGISCRISPGHNCCYTYSSGASVYIERFLALNS